MRWILLPLFALLAASPCGTARAQAPVEAKWNLVHPLPPQAPPWLDGYAVRWPVRVLGEFSKQADAKTVLVSVPTSGWLKPDASDLAVQTGAGAVLPAHVVSHDPLGDTIVQFPRNGIDPWYWVYGVGAKAGPKADPKTLREGVTLELRDWLGDDLSSWAKVRAGLEKSPGVIGNAVVGDVLQNCNPARPDQSAKFAASYRGHLVVARKGTHRFVVNADDASFLFIDGFKVFERAGANSTLGTVKLKDLEKIAGKVDLEPGVHAFEVHQAVGDKLNASGVCALLWSPPGEAKFAFAPSAAMAQPLYARVAAVEKPDGTCPGALVHGLDDSLEMPGVKLFLARFEAHGLAKDDKALLWDFGDGTTGTGRSVMHVYFKEGDYVVALKADTGLPALKRRVRVWGEPGENSPLTLEDTVAALAGMDWPKLGPTRAREMFTFLQACQQPGRWPLLGQVAESLLKEKDLDLDLRSQLVLAKMESLAQAGRVADALKFAEPYAAEFKRAPALVVRLQMGVAAIHQYHAKDAAAASKIYKAILDENSRVEHPNLRLAAIRWGDLFADAGDLARASETYRVAATLGGDKFNSTATTDASTRGAILRIAEQKLRGGEILATRQLLERLELDYPGRRLDGLYCHLRAESDRFAGRYEEAMRSYEMIFRLPQWAGYRDRAAHGIADCHLRLGELDKALKWLGEVKQAHPKYFEERKLAEAEKLLVQRIARVQAAKDKGDPGAAAFQAFVTGFEPGESQWFGDFKDGAVVRSLGMHGPHSGLLDMHPRELGNFEHLLPLRDLAPGTTLWLEVWYRDLVKLSPPAQHQQPYAQFILTASDDAKLTVQANANMPRNANHHWHKAGVKLKLPLAQDMDLKVVFANITGAWEIDRLVVRPVLDRHLDSLMIFQEGAKAP